MYVRVNNLGSWYDFLWKGPQVPSWVPCWLTPANQIRPECGGPLATQRVTPGTTPVPGQPSTAPSDSGTSIFIPDSSVPDILKNVITGKPTDAQIQKNTDYCVQAIQNIRALASSQGKASGIPANAEQQCALDQEAYKKLIGGTADKQAPKTALAVIILAGVMAGVYVVTR